MKKKLLDLKSIFVGVVVGALLFGGVVTASTLVSNVYFNKYPIYSNGSLYNPTMPLLNYQGRTYVPLDEFGKISGASVSFNNNTIYVNSNQNSYYDSNYNYFTYSSSTSKDIEVDVDDTESFYVNLNSHNSRSASISCSSSYIKLSRTSLTYSGSVTVTGKKEGKATIKISYSNGDVEYIYVTVNDDDDYEDELEIEVGESDTFYIDLDDYDADKATLSYDDDYIKLSKDTVKSSGKITVTGKEEGDTKIKIKYDTGDIDYIYVEITDDDDYEDEIELEVGDTDSFYVDLDDYDADKATLSFSGSCIKLSKTTLYSSGKVTVTGKSEGNTTIKIKYDTGDIDYIDVTVEDEDNDYNEDYSEIEFSSTGKISFYIDLDYYDADKATLTYDSSYVSLSQTTFTSSGKVTITGKKKGTTQVKVKYDTGDIEYIDIELY